MPYTNSYIELHAGFPDDRESGAAAARFLQAHPAERSWTRSEVTAVHMKSPGCIDPHNVPGTLGFLVSCAIQNQGRPWASVISDVVVPTGISALDTLGGLGAGDCRLEIECPFGWLSVRDGEDAGERRKVVSEPVTIPTHVLQRIPGAMPDIPKWEIHFVAEPRVGVASKLAIDSLPAMIERHGVDIEQTIQYRSQAMLESGVDDYKFISTSYYQTPADVVSEATRLFEHTTLPQDLWAEGYRLTLILEHIVGCFQPLATAQNAAFVSNEEVHSAR